MISRQVNRQSRLQKQLEDFQEALGDTLIAATGVEVNTVIVSEINATKFNPGETYQSMLELDAEYLGQNVHESLRGQYRQLQQQLQQDSRALLGNSSATASLPSQGDLKQQLLSNPRFLRSLRKVAEVKAILDRRNHHLLHSTESSHTQDLIFAQTVTQLDGDIFHYYATELLDHPQRDTIVELHRSGVKSSDQQWRGWLRFLLQIAQTLCR